MKEEAEHNEWLELTLSTGSNYQPRRPAPAEPPVFAPLEPTPSSSLQLHRYPTSTVQQPQPQEARDQDGPSHQPHPQDQDGRSRLGRVPRTRNFVDQPARRQDQDGPSRHGRAPRTRNSVGQPHPQDQDGPSRHGRASRTRNSVDQPHPQDQDGPSRHGRATRTRNSGEQPQPQEAQDQDGPSRQGRAPRTRNAVREGWTKNITPPYPWAKSTRANVHSLEHLLSNNIEVISGEVHCKNCQKRYEIEFDLRTKFFEIAGFIAEYKYDMHDRAPSSWSNPVALDCKFCNCAKCVIPVIAKKRSTNWLFLFLGQMIGYCKLTHLKYFCKHADIHKTGAKDRLLYSIYLGLYEQLDPKCIFIYK